ncbi:MAG TPA: ribosome biogenesis GTPase Der [Anaerolineaceae bacterium]|nr:ribosome biogenesis GTPase Der [Anaerolineaceae bacterium]HOH20490.1 ribosome biogenesis GTPase Der [Anaerolineaceae bacterium]HOU44609.1 ribosome biogenesis GTPase Der [Anaerolineaceae bacterium]HQF45972.1 ribosome biogenesis GTPase Der [Anaerolineaceae bacterium]HQH35696.1 ribosome biogenesis GTPase Der [Anaerolineaceae bacterium]
MRKPVVALVGRPNVGKSTLFNRLAGEPLAIVDDTPGTTRDRLLSEGEWSGIPFFIVDTGGIDPSEGGRTPLSVGSAEFIEEIRSQAEIAIQEADVVLFVVDAISGVTPADREVAQILRRSQQIRDGSPYPPVLLVVNKADSAGLRSSAPEFFELGMGEPHPISAVHGTGTGDLLDVLVESFPKGEPEEDDSIKIAIVGKPNVGKSSLLNRLVGADRAIVSDIPGTTRDAIDTRMDYDGLPLTLIDTAGIRRRGRIERGVEKYSVIRSLRAIERADVALLVVDATGGLTAQDAHIAGFILDAWKSAVVVVNKWDAVEKDTHTLQQYTERIRQELKFLSYVPILFISAKTGQRVDQVLPMALRVQEERLARVPTGALNRILQTAQDVHIPSSKSGRALKVYYGTQVGANPPTFLVHVNDPKLAHFTYIRFLENRIREEFPFTGTPIRVILKARR